MQVQHFWVRGLALYHEVQVTSCDTVSRIYSWTEQFCNSAIQKKMTLEECNCLKWSTWRQTHSQWCRSPSTRFTRHLKRSYTTDFALHVTWSTILFLTWHVKEHCCTKHVISYSQFSIESQGCMQWRPLPFVNLLLMYQIRFAIMSINNECLSSTISAYKWHDAGMKLLVIIADSCKALWQINKRYSGFAMLSKKRDQLRWEFSQTNNHSLPFS